MSNQRKNKQTDLFEMLPQAIAALKKNIIVLGLWSKQLNDLDIESTKNVLEIK